MQPLTCQIHESCLSATCYTNTSTISFELQPCSESKSIHLTLSGSLPGSEFRSVRVQGLGRVQIQEGESDAENGYLQVFHWNLTSSTLQFGIQVLLFILQFTLFCVVLLTSRLYSLEYRSTVYFILCGSSSP